MRVQSLRREDPLEEEIATHSSILCLENSIDRGIWQATVHSAAESDTTEHACLRAHPFPYTDLGVSFSIIHGGHLRSLPG